MVGGGLGVMVVALIVFLLGGDPTELLRHQGGPSGATLQESGNAVPADDPLSRFVAVVLADTEDVWNELFNRMGRTYQEPTLVLFTDRVSSAYVVPDSFTHGTSQQRVRWFRRGFETGDLNQGDTFRVSESQL